MSVRNILPGPVSLPPGYYRLQAKVGKLSLVDLGDSRRTCMLHPRGDYYLHLKTPLDHGHLEPKSAGSGAERLEISRLSSASFLARMMIVAGRRHALQRFGSQERLLLFAKDRADLEEAAFDNVEFRYLRLYGLDDEAVRKNGWSWIENAWPTKTEEIEPVAKAASEANSSCVYVHMHYWETWPEIENILHNDCRGLDIVVTSTTEKVADFERIRAHFPQSRIIVTENRGRDVGPFMELLRTGVFDRYDAVCKIHGKLSKKNGRETRSGKRIRRYILACLLADGACQKAVEMFASDPELGLAGPANLLLPPEGESVEKYIKSERKQMSSVCLRAGADFIPGETEFFAGTMFWFRPAALNSLRHASIGILDFEPENGGKRNTLQHAMERLFCLFAKKTGFKIAKLEPLPGGKAATNLEGT